MDGQRIHNCSQNKVSNKPRGLLWPFTIVNVFGYCYSSLVVNPLRNLRGSARDRRRICRLPCASPQPIPRTPERHRGPLTVPLLKPIRLEVEYDTRLVLEIVLTAGGGVVEASVKVIDFSRPEGDRP